jgi:deoxyribodipyrimidine photo-lyase
MSPTDLALADAVAAINIAAYAKTRNHLDGRVTRLSPYLTHGFTSVPALFAQLPKLTLDDKLAFELGWREFFHHVWHRAGDAILADMRTPLPGIQYAARLPDDIREGRTGLPVIDRAVHTLYQTGYLHNHARMWLASYTVHLRKVHWRVAADWMYGHLLDGDLASNHLSWQWIAATFSSKPYLFNAENVERHASAAWHCPGSAIDVSYEALETMARSQTTVDVTPSLLGISEPALSAAPDNLSGDYATLSQVRQVQLVHPWMLADHRFGGLRLGVIHRPFHQHFPWSQQRWDFVMQRLQAVTDLVFIGDLAELSTILVNAADISSVATLNPGYRELLPVLCSDLQDSPRRFPDPDTACRSFSAFWSHCTAASADAPRRTWHR